MSSSVSPAVDKEEDRLTGLIQSQQWLDGFAQSRKIVMWDNGDEGWDGVEDGEYYYPLGVSPPL
jgi:hypothetical protein